MESRIGANFAVAHWVSAKQYGEQLKESFRNATEE